MKLTILLISFIFCAHSLKSQDLSVINLNSAFDNYVYDIKTYDYGGGVQKIVLYGFKSTSTGDVKTGIIKFDLNDNIIYNSSYSSGVSNVGIYLYKVCFGFDGFLYALGEKITDPNGSPQYETLLFKLNPVNGNIVYSKKIDGFYNNYGRFVPTDMMDQFGVLYLAGFTVNRANSSLPLTKSIVLQINLSTGVNKVSEIYNPTNPTSSSLSMRQIIGGDPLGGFELGGWINGNGTDVPKVCHIFYYPHPNPTSYHFDVSQVNVTSEEVSDWSFGTYDGAPLLAMRMINNSNDFIIAKFGVFMIPQWVKSYSHPNLQILPNAGNRSSLNGHNNAIISSSKISIMGMKRGSLPSSGYRYYLGQFDVNTGDPIKSDFYPLRVPFPPFGVGMGNDFNFDVDYVTESITGYAQRFPGNVNDQNKFYYWKIFESDCKETIPLQSISKTVTTNARNDFQVFNSNLINMQSVSIQYAIDNSVDKSLVCSESLRTSDGFTNEDKSLVFDTRPNSSLIDGGGGTTDGRQSKNSTNTLSEGSRNTMNFVIKTNLGFTDIHSERIIKALSVYTIDGKLLYVYDKISSNSFSFKLKETNMFLIFRIEYKDGEIGTKKIFIK